MAEINKTSKAILGENASKIGSYQEAPGGGTPKMSGGGRGAMNKDFKVAHSQEEADKIRENDPNAKVRVMQPRDEDGQFTYNSANAKELKHGPSRGTTIPPFLKGVKITYVQEGSEFKTVDGKILISVKAMNREQLAEAFKYYLNAEKGFQGLNEEATIGKKGNPNFSKKFQNSEAGLLNADKTREDYSEETQQRMDKAKAKMEANERKEFPEINPETDRLDEQGYAHRRPGVLRYWEKLQTRVHISPSLKPEPKPNEEDFKFDKEMAKNNPEEFYKANKEIVDAIVTALENVKDKDKNVKFDRDTVIYLIGEGEIDESIFDDDGGQGGGEELPKEPDLKTQPEEKPEDKPEDEKKKAWDLFGEK